MSESDSRTPVGRVAAIWRYPVKSMRGERLATVEVGPAGLTGDRQFAVIDCDTGRVASAKNPRKWASLLEVRAELRDGELVVTLPDGAEHRADIGAVLSRFLSRAVEVRRSPPPSAAIEIEWPDIPGLPGAGSQSVEPLPVGGYFDLAPIHLVTTASLRRLSELAPGTDCDERRFRPNVVIEVLPEWRGFVERKWVGRKLGIGDEARLHITAPCSRCVMTTLAQPGLAEDSRVLRVAVAHNDATVGVYARADRVGSLAVDSPVWLG